MDELVGQPVDAVLRGWFKAELAGLLALPEPEHFECEACGGPMATAAAELVTADCVVTGLELRRRACPHCGLICGPLQLMLCPPERLGQLYEIFYRFYAEGESGPFQEKTFYLMNPSRYGAYLNYACGVWSRGVQRLLDLGWKVEGFEPFVRQFHPAIHASLAAVSGKTYDGIMTHNYLEHPQSISAFFRDLHGMLNEGGLMAHSTPCYDYLFERSPFHLYFLTGRSLQALAARTGFEIVSRHETDRHDLGGFYHCVLFRRLAQGQAAEA